MPIEHLVIVMMENHSFDEYFGTFPNAAGFSDDSPAFSQPWGSATLQPWRASTFTSTGSAPQVLGHVWSTFHTAVGMTTMQAGSVYSATGDNLGFSASQGGGSAPEGTMSFYAANDLPYHWALASNFALCDRYFQSVLGGTFPNRMYVLGGSILANGAATTGLETYTGFPNPPIIYNDTTIDDGTPNTSVGPNAPGAPAPFTNAPLSYLETLVANNVSYQVYDDWNWTWDWQPTPNGSLKESDLNVCGYYPLYNNPPQFDNVMLGTFGDPNYRSANYTDGAERTPAAIANNDMRPLFAQDVAPLDPAADGPGALAAVTWIYPPWAYCEHPSAPSVTQAADGGRYLSQIVDALIDSEFWESTVLVVVYDESNNHFDHAVPPMASSDEETWVTDTSQGGFNQPAPIGAGPRVPAIVVSPWTYRQGLIHDQMDHTSLLQLAEDVTVQKCPTLPLGGWRRNNFTDLGTAIANLGSSFTPASVINQDRNSPGGLPTWETAQQWQTNASNRYAYASTDAGSGDPSAQPLQPPSVAHFPPPTQSCEITLVQASYGRGQVVSQAGGADTATFPGMIQVAVAGFEPTELTTQLASGGFGTLSSQPTITTRVPTVNFYDGDQQITSIMASPSSVSPDPTTTSTESGVPALFTFFYDVTFNDVATLDIFDFPVNTTLSLRVEAVFTVDATFVSSAPLELVRSSDPQFYNLVYQNTPWLSDELRVAQFTSSTTAFGFTLGTDPVGFVANVLNALNNDVQNNGGNLADPWFDALYEDEYQAWLNLMQDVGSEPVYNFAFARVHMEGLEQAQNVRVFFRLFPANSTGTFYTPEYYLTQTTNLGPPAGSPGLISVPGVGFGSWASQYVSLPFYATERVPYTADLNTQSDTPNVRNIPPDGVTPTAGTTYEAYYGCWLDINQPGEQYIPEGGYVPADPAEVSGPFTQAPELESPLAWMRGLHQCVVAEISYTPITIPYASNPGSSPWLIQRNVVWVPTAGGA